MTACRRSGGNGRAILALLAALLLVLGLAGCSSSAAAPTASAGASAPTAATASAGASASTAPPVATQPAKDPVSGLATIALADLPSQARATLSLIDVGGPYPHSQDGAVFQNREGILPKQASGYYHEYTVETPGSSDRGARRIISGRAGERYYTADHYASFLRIWP